MPPNKNAATGAISFTALLNALDGVAYVVAPDGEVLHVGEPHWSEAAAGHSAPGLTGRLVVGRDLFGAIVDPKVRQLQERMHRQVFEGQSPLVSYTYRCDRPDMLRRMRMAISPVTEQGSTVAALYQSTVLEESLRPPLGIFERLGSPNSPIITLCSYCHDVTWPAGTPASDAIWIEPQEYYRRGGVSEVMLSHGICPDCFNDLWPGKTA